MSFLPARPSWFPPVASTEVQDVTNGDTSIAGRAPGSATPVMRRDVPDGLGTPPKKRRHGDKSGNWSPVVELDVLTRGLGLKLDAEIVILFGSGAVGSPAETISSWGVRAPSGRMALPRSEGLVGRMLESGHAVVGPLASTEDRTLTTAAGGRRLTHAAVIPITSGSRLQGVLCVGFSGPPPGEEAVTLWIADAYARLMAVCLRDPGVFDVLLLGAHHDSLTGCLNYASVRRELATEIKRSAKHGLAVSCYFLDLQGFRRVNDSYGHPYGNGVLSGIGTSLRNNVRHFDTVGRYGGDEFFVILPETTEEEARALADRVRPAVRSLVLPSGEALEAAIGIAQWVPGSSSEFMIAQADRAMHAAKRTEGGIVAASELAEAASSVDQVA